MDQALGCNYLVKSNLIERPVLWSLCSIWQLSQHPTPPPWVTSRADPQEGHLLGKKSTPALSRLQKRSLLFSSGAIYRRQAKPEHNQSIVTVDFKEELALAHNGYRQTQEKLETEMCLNFSKHRRALFMLHFQIAFSLILLCKFEHFWANIHHCRI